MSRPTDASLSSPPERRGLHRGVPELDHLVVELQERERHALHLERGDVVAHERPRDRRCRAPPAPPRRVGTRCRARPAACRPCRSRTAARGRRSRGQVLEDRLESRSTSWSAGSSLIRSRPGSPWMPMPISISSSASVKLGSPACGTMQGVSARPIDRAFAFTRSAIVGDLVERVAALGRRSGDLLDQHGARRRRGDRRCTASP